MSVSNHPPDFDALDALIDEALGGSGPPDQSDAILRRLNVPVIDTRVRRRQKPIARSRGRLPIVAAATAAGVLVALGVGWQLRAPEAAPEPVAVAPPPAGPPVGPPAQTEPPPAEPSPAPPAAPLQLALDDRPIVDSVIETPLEDAPSGGIGPVPLRLTPPRAAESAAAYYAAVGLTPTPDVDDDALADRLSERLGINLAAEDLRSLTVLAARLSRDDATAAIADRWQTVNEAWADDAGRDELAQVLSTPSDAAESYFRRSAAKVDRYSMHATSWASLAVGVDARCARCHDGTFGTLDRKGHWSLMAALSGGDEPLFYQDADSRQVLADPNDAPEVDRRTAAAGWVDSMWRVVHGRPLRAGGVDPGSGDLPTDDIRRTLIDDTLAVAGDGPFDLSRLTAQIIRHPLTRRVEAPGGAEWLPVERRDEFERMVAAYAAAPVSEPPRLRRVELVRSRLGGLDVTTLGQIRDDVEPEPAEAPPSVPDESATMPIDGDRPAAAWWSRIDDPAVLRDHLAYLRHRDTLEDRWIELDDAMAAAGIDPMTRANRLWWAMK